MDGQSVRENAERASQIKEGSLVEFMREAQHSNRLLSGMVIKVYKKFFTEYATVRIVVGASGEMPDVPLASLRRCSKITRPFVFGLLKSAAPRDMSPFSHERMLLDTAEAELSKE